MQKRQQLLVDLVLQGRAHAVGPVGNNLERGFLLLASRKEALKVSEELLALRVESRRTSAQELEQGSTLKAQADAAVAQELDAKTILLQSQLYYIQAHDEMTQAMGLTPE